MIIDPILEESERYPVVRPGTAVIAFDGTAARRASAAPPSPGATAPLPESETEGAQPVFNETSLLGRVLSRTSTAAGNAGSRLARASGKVFVDAARRSKFGAAVFGHGERYFLVDTSRKSANVDFQVPSSRVGLAFDIMLAFDVRVTDPEAVVHEGVRDLVGLFAPRMKRIAERAASAHPPKDSLGARGAVERALGESLEDAGVLASGISARVEPDETALALIRLENEVDLRLAAIAAKNQIDEAERRAVIEAITRPEHAIAAWIATGDPRYREAWVAQVQEKRGSREEMMAVLRMGLEKGIIERHEIADAFPDLGADIIRALLHGEHGQSAGLLGGQRTNETSGDVEA